MIKIEITDRGWDGKLTSSTGEIETLLYKLVIMAIFNALEKHCRYN